MNLKKLHLPYLYQTLILNGELPLPCFQEKGHYSCKTCSILNNPFFIVPIEFSRTRQEKSMKQRLFYHLSE